MANELIGLEGVTGMDGLPVAGHGTSARSVSLPRLLDGRLSFWRTANSWRRSDKTHETGPTDSEHAACQALVSQV